MKSDVLALYVDPQWRDESLSHIPLLFQEWGNAFSSSQPLMRAIFDRYPPPATSYRIVHRLEQADVVLLPYRYQTVRAKKSALMREVHEVAQRAGMLLLVDAVGDEDVTIEDDTVLVLKYAGYRSELRANEIIIPPYADDLWERYGTGEWKPREKSVIPTIGFAGWTKLTPLQTLRALIKDTPRKGKALFDSSLKAHEKGVLIRRRILAQLRTSREVELALLERGSYSGNVLTAEADQETLVREFVSNVLESDLALDVRGDANASTRLFEVLSLGKVPLIIDTDRNFPFSDIVDYNSFSITIDISEMSRLSHVVRTAYDCIAPSEWLEMQKRARATYLSYFRADHMMGHLAQEIQKRL